VRTLENRSYSNRELFTAVTATVITEAFAASCRELLLLPEEMQAEQWDAMAGLTQSPKDGTASPGTRHHSPLYLILGFPSETEHTRLGSGMNLAFPASSQLPPVPSLVGVHVGILTQPTSRFPFMLPARMDLALGVGWVRRVGKHCGEHGIERAV